MMAGLRSRRASVVLAAGLLLAALPGPALAITPVDGGGIFISPVDINLGAGDQYDAHVNGDLVSYTSAGSIRAYDFVTGDDVEIAGMSNHESYQISDASDGLIAFVRLDFDTGDIDVRLYDSATATVGDVTSDTAGDQSHPSIGGQTIAFVDDNSDASSVSWDIVAARLSGSVVQLSTAATFDYRPSVAPSGDVIAWHSCPVATSNCDIAHATWDGAVWTIIPVTSTPTPEANPSTDGAIVTYDATRDGERHVFWQPVGGGAEQRIDLAGEQRHPTVDAGLISFESTPPGATASDLFLYHVVTNRLFQVTSTPWDESLNDVDVLPDGRVRLVWSSGAVGSRDVHGATIELPPAGPDYEFGGFQSPVDPRPMLNAVKAGAAVPVRFSLGGDVGLEVFTAGYPRSEVIACDSTADVDAIEQTVAAGGSSLTYDPLSDTYSYVWKTDRAWAGSCRQLVLSFADGSTARANFKLR